MATTLIDPSALAALVARDAVCLFDCRADLADPSAAHHAFTVGHIPGAAFLDLETDLSAHDGDGGGRHPLPDRARLARRLAGAGLSPGRQVVVYDDQGGAYAARAWWLLRWLGHGEVALLDGGLQGWVADGHPLESGEERPRPPGTFSAGSPPPPGWTADAAEIAGAIGTGRLLVIDARTPERFAGAAHPLDRVSGHIPGARNRFFRDNLGLDGRFKSAEALRQDFHAVLDGASPADTVVQCGSGVTACHDLLAMEVAGLSGARLYPGSWSDWTSDPARPIASS